MSEQKIPIPAMLYNAAVGGHVTNSQQIIDEDYNLEQKDVNKEVLGIPYNSTSPNGMGRIVLKKNDNFKQVVEAQTNGNTIFVIRYDFTLTGDVTVPANCVLEFDGGSVSAGSGENQNVINGNNCPFNYTANYHIFKDVIIKYFNIPYLDIRWFGAKVAVDSVTGEDCSYAFDKTLESLRYNPYIYINVIGTYVIKRSIVTDLDLCLRGSSFRTSEMSVPATPSAVASKFIIADGVTGFLLEGRGATYKYNQIDIESVSFFGEGSKSATAIKITATGAPGRPSNINKCQFVNFAYAIKIEEQSYSVGSTMGNLNISTCSIINCGKAVYASTLSYYGTTNLQILNCNIEHNDYCCIDVNTFGNLVIINNILEGEDTPIKVKIHFGTATINDNYFESSTSQDHPFSVIVEGTNYNPLEFKNNSYVNSVSFSKVKLTGHSLLNNNSIYSNCLFDKADINDISIKNIDRLCFFINTTFPPASNIVTPTSKSSFNYDRLYKGNVLVKRYTTTYVWNFPSNAEGDILITLKGCIWKNNQQTSGYVAFSFTNSNYDTTPSVTLYKDGEFVAIGKISKRSQDNLFLMAYNNLSYILLNWYNLFDSYSEDDPISKYIGEDIKIGSSLDSAPTINTSNSCEGFEFYNKTTSKPNYWDGSKWIDATGTPV